MSQLIHGIHHVTAIADDAQANIDFYTQVLGQRLIKITVNFDDPSAYHLYYGDAVGTPGTIMTHFPYAGSRRAMPGPGAVVEVHYQAPIGSIPFWERHLEKFSIPIRDLTNQNGSPSIAFEDPDGMVLRIVETERLRETQYWEQGGISKDVALTGFAGFRMMPLRGRSPYQKFPDSETVLTDLYGYHASGEGFDSPDGTTRVEIIPSPAELRALGGHGSVHHIAFRAKDYAEHELAHELVRSAGFHVTPIVERDYFRSIYFREPGGILYEIASDNPGFMIDESYEELGTSLRLPKQYESKRKLIEEHLPSIQIPRGASLSGATTATAE